MYICAVFALVAYESTRPTVALVAMLMYAINLVLIQIVCKSLSDPNIMPAGRRVPDSGIGAKLEVESLLKATAG